MFSRGKSILPVLFITFALNATGAFALHPTTVLKKMEKEWNAIDTLRARVRQVYRDHDGRIRNTYEGRMSVRRPRNLRFDFGEPGTAEIAKASPEVRYDFTVFTTDGKYLFEYNRIEQTLTRDSIRTLDSLPFLKAVAGIEEFNQERFNQELYVIAPVLEELVGSVPVYVLRVRPRQGYEELHDEFDLWVGCEDGLPRKIKLELDQETVEVDIDGYVVNEAMPPEEFDVSIPAGVDLIDRTRQF